MLKRLLTSLLLLAGMAGAQTTVELIGPAQVNTGEPIETELQVSGDAPAALGYSAGDGSTSAIHADALAASKEIQCTSEGCCLVAGFNQTTMTGGVASIVFPAFSTAGSQIIELNGIVSASPEGQSFEVSFSPLTVEVVEAESSDLLAHYAFEGSMLGADSGPLGNDGAVINAEASSDTPDGSAGSIRLLGGESGVYPPSFDAEGAGLTISAWIKPASFPNTENDGRIVSKANGSAADAHVWMLSTIAVDGETRLRGRLNTGGSTATLIADSGAIQLNQWQHAAMTYDGAAWKLYLDGVEVGSMAMVGAVTVDASVPVAVGNQPSGSRPFDGWMDDVRILQTAVSATEVQQIADSTGSAADLNADGVVDKIDWDLAVAQALGVDPCGSADLNGDGACNALDVQIVVTEAT